MPLGTLSKLKQLLSEPGIAKRIGEAYEHAYREEPQMLLYGKERAQTPEAMRAKYGMNIQELSSRKSGPYTVRKTFFQPEELSHIPKRGLSLEQYPGEAFLYDYPDRAADIGFSARDLERVVDPVSTMGEISAMLAKPGSNLAARTYPAIYEHAANKGITPFVELLTDENISRRALNTWPSIFRYPEMKQFPGIQQLEETGLRPAEFSKLSPQEQVGQLLINSTLRTDDIVRDAIERRKSKFEEEAWGVKNRGELRAVKSKQLALDKLENLGPSLSVESSTPQREAYVGALRSLGLQSVGDRTIRHRLALEAIARGEPVDPSFYRGIGYREGGPVKVCSGALSQLTFKPR